MEPGSTDLADISKSIDEILWGIVHNAHPRRPGKQPRWACVRDAIGCGAGVAMTLCSKFDANPDDMVGEDQLEYLHECGVHVDEDGEVSSWSEEDENQSNRVA